MPKISKKLRNYRKNLQINRQRHRRQPVMDQLMVEESVDHPKDHMDGNENLSMETLDRDYFECTWESPECKKEPNVNPLDNTDFEKEDTPDSAENILIKEEPLEFEEVIDPKAKTGFEHKVKPNMTEHIYFKEESSEFDEMEEEVPDPQLPTSMFYSCKEQNVIVPYNSILSEDEDTLDEDVADPDILPDLQHDPDIPGCSDMEPPTKKKCTRSAMAVIDDLVSSDADDVDDPRPRTSKGKETKKKLTPRVTKWTKVDISNEPLESFEYPAQPHIQSAQKYFFTFFSVQLIKHITHQTNLYATQKDSNTTFSTKEDEIMNFVAILLYMGIVQCPSVDDYWSMQLRIPQVADIMSSKRFRLLRRMLHFNDSSQAQGSIDRFFKIRPLFAMINEAFRSVPETPKQSIDEVMVAYKGKTAGNLRQYMKNKPDKWGFKLFCRASEDGFIHDTILYQGKMTLQSHGIPLTSEQEAMGFTSQIVSVLASTMRSTKTCAIYADNYFTSSELARYLKERNYRHTETARDCRIGNPPLKSAKEMEKKSVPCGHNVCLTKDDDILVLKWKDNKVVTMLSTDLRVEPVTKFQRYDSTTKMKEVVPCPSVIKSYNMGGIDKSDILVHLYKTPMKSKRWYMRLFAYIVDMCLINSWLLYRRDCKALNINGMPLKDFRLEVFLSAAGKKPTILHPLRSSLSSPSTITSVNVPVPILGHRSHKPDPAMRFDMTLFHAPLFVNRQTCKFCSKQGNIIRSNIICRVCLVHLCLNDKRNCFIKYHENVAYFIFLYFISFQEFWLLFMFCK